jgi:hypothetical protein
MSAKVGMLLNAYRTAILTPNCYLQEFVICFCLMLRAARVREVFLMLPSARVRDLFLRACVAFFIWQLQIS